jgi:hypothetical protein
MKKAAACLGLFFDHHRRCGKTLTPLGSQPDFLCFSSFAPSSGDRYTIAA